MTLTIDIPEHEAGALKAKAQAQGVSPEQYARLVLEEDLKEPLRAEAEPDRRQVSDMIEEIIAKVPPAEFARLPVDGAREHDHYLYGHPKRNRRVRFLPIHRTGSLSPAFKTTRMQKRKRWQLRLDHG